MVPGLEMMESRCSLGDGGYSGSSSWLYILLAREGGMVPEQS